MITVLVDRPLEGEGGRWPLAAEERHHLRVRRTREGEPVRVLDGRGRVGEGFLAERPDGLGVNVVRIVEVPPPPPCVLIVGAGDRERYAWLVEKAAELGVTEIIPLETERTTGVADRVREAHLPRLRRRARETLKQCGAAWELTVHPPLRVPEAAARAGKEGEWWLADPAGAEAPPVGANDAVTVVIGPEGGLAASERDAFVAAGFHPVRLAPQVLRFETAAIAAAALIAHRRTRGPHV